MNMNAMLQQAQKLQRDLERKQNELKATEFVGDSQMATVILMGDKTLKSVVFKNLESIDVDDLEMLQDMIKIAHDDAVRKIETATEEKMGPYAKQLGGLI